MSISIALFFDRGMIDKQPQFLGLKKFNPL
jgi:hypothetical protein